jgi:hypothetical protein
MAQLLKGIAKMFMNDRQKCGENGYAVLLIRAFLDWTWYPMKVSTIIFTGQFVIGP